MVSSSNARCIAILAFLTLISSVPSISKCNRFSPIYIV